MDENQLKYLDNLELALANMIHDGHRKWAKSLAPVIKWLQQDEPVTAVLEGEAVGLSESVLDSMRKTFNVKKF